MSSRCWILERYENGGFDVHPRVVAVYTNEIKAMKDRHLYQYWELCRMKLGEYLDMRLGQSDNNRDYAIFSKLQESMNHKVVPDLFFIRPTELIS